MKGERETKSMHRSAKDQDLHLYASEKPSHYVLQSVWAEMFVVSERICNRACFGTKMAALNL